MSADVIVGIQWGDEGKGKIVDMLAQKYRSEEHTSELQSQR